MGRARLLPGALVRPARRLPAFALAEPSCEGFRTVIIIIIIIIIIITPVGA